MTNDTRNSRIDKHSCMTEYGTCHIRDKTIMESFLNHRWFLFFSIVKQAPHRINQSTDVLKLVW